MKLLSFRHGGRDRIGVLVSGDAVVDLADAAKEAGEDGAAFTDMLDLIQGGEGALGLARRVEAFAVANPDKVARIPVSDIAFLPPVRRPGKVCGIALNNNASDDRKVSAPNHPMFFIKPATCLVGHGQAIVVKDAYGRVHPEPELAVVVGKTAKDIDPREGYDYVFGYSIMDDITGQDMRQEDMVHYLALYPKADNPDEVERREQHLSYAARYKGADTFGPFGPYLVTRDEIPDPHALDFEVRIGGELYAEDSTRYYTYKVPEVIAFISRHLTLEPGDVISMGTAFRAGGAGRPLHTGNLQRVDGPVAVTIQGLGTLSNPVERVSTASLPDWRLPR